MALVYNKQTQQLQGFKDGVSIFDWTGLIGATFPQPDNLYGKTVIGRGEANNPSSNSGYNSVIVDEVLFYNRPLSADEISAIYSSYPDPNW